MKVKLLKKFRKQAKENVYLKNYYCEDGNDDITIICVKADFTSVSDAVCDFMKQFDNE